MPPWATLPGDAWLRLHVKSLGESNHLRSNSDFSYLFPMLSCCSFLQLHNELKRKKTCRLHVFRVRHRQHVLGRGGGSDFVVVGLAVDGLCAFPLLSQARREVAKAFKLHLLPSRRAKSTVEGSQACLRAGAKLNAKRVGTGPCSSSDSREAATAVPELRKLY